MSNRKRDRHASDLSDHADRHAETERHAIEAARAKREIAAMDEQDRRRLEARRAERRPRR
jgi:hypothetical protein